MPEHNQESMGLGPRPNSSPIEAHSLSEEASIALLKVLES